jgi:hypothetical protein
LCFYVRRAARNRGGLGLQEIVDDLEAALEQFRLIAGDLAGGAVERGP